MYVTSDAIVDQCIGRVKLSIFITGTKPGMVKRKADINLDEWLREGTLYAEAKRDGAAETVNHQVAEHSQGIEATPVEADTVTLPPTMADLAEHAAAEWFWDLLAQSGYELW